MAQIAAGTVVKFQQLPVGRARRHRRVAGAVSELGRRMRKVVHGDGLHGRDRAVQLLFTDGANTPGDSYRPGDHIVFPEGTAARSRHIVVKLGTTKDDAGVESQVILSREGLAPLVEDPGRLENGAITDVVPEDLR